MKRHVHARKPKFEQAKPTHKTGEALDSSCIPRPLAKPMMITILTRGQEDWQQGPWTIEAGLVYMMTAAARCLKLAITLLASIIQRLCLDLSQHRSTNQQIVVTHSRPIPNMIEAPLPLMKLTQTHCAISSRNIPSHTAFDTMITEHMHRVCLLRLGNVPTQHALYRACENPKNWRNSPLTNNVCIWRLTIGLCLLQK